MEKRGRELTLANAEGFLRRLSALELLNRLPTAIIGVGPLGDIAYANPAFAEMLGYINATTVARVHLPSVLIGHEALTPCDCLRTVENRRFGRRLETQSGLRNPDDGVIAAFGARDRHPDVDRSRRCHRLALGYQSADKTQIGSAASSLVEVLGPSPLPCDGAEHLNRDCSRPDPLDRDGKSPPPERINR